MPSHGMIAKAVKQMADKVPTIKKVAEGTLPRIRGIAALQPTIEYLL